MKSPNEKPIEKPAEAIHRVVVPEPEQEATLSRIPETGELPDAELQEVSGGARITKTELLKL